MYPVCTCSSFGSTCPIHGQPQQHYYYPPTLYPGNVKGWECPKCTRVYSPSTAECSICNNLASIYGTVKGGITTTTTDNTGNPSVLESLTKLVAMMQPCAPIPTSSRDGRPEPLDPNACSGKPKP